jgi:hypothetical protein
MASSSDSSVFTSFPNTSVAVVSTVIFNYRSLRVFKACVVKDWRKVLGKRRQKGCMSWANYRQLLIAFPFPDPVIHQASNGRATRQIRTLGSAWGDEFKKPRSLGEGTGAKASDNSEAPQRATASRLVSLPSPGLRFLGTHTRRGTGIGYDGNTIS